MKIDFEAELKSKRPEVLIQEGKKDELSDFFLTLGMFYNDLKSLYFHVLQTEEYFGDVADEASVKAGEAGGLLAHLERLIIATVHEFFNFLEGNGKVMEKEEFKLLYGRMSKDHQNVWNQIVSIALAKKTDTKSDFTHTLLRIRNDTAFHYNKKILRRGFIKKFFDSETHSSNQAAYYYIGDTMQDTRFFYCDGAIQSWVREKMSEKIGEKTQSEVLRGIIEQMNFAIHRLMKEFLRDRK